MSLNIYQGHLKIISRTEFPSSGVVNVKVFGNVDSFSFFLFFSPYLFIYFSD